MIEGMDTPAMRFPEIIKRLAQARGLSVAKLGYLAFDLETRGTNPDTLNKAMQGKVRLNDALARAIAQVLEVTPETFVEYRLSQLRHRLDEQEVGFERAAKLLAEIERALPTPTAPESPEALLADLMERDLGAAVERGSKQHTAAETNSPASRRKARVS